jgi:hypothetical protein
MIKIHMQLYFDAPNLLFCCKTLLVMSFRQYIHLLTLRQKHVDAIDRPSMDTTQSFFHKFIQSFGLLLLLETKPLKLHYLKFLLCLQDLLAKSFPLLATVIQFYDQTLDIRKTKIRPARLYTDKTG